MNSQAAALRKDIEARLEARIPAALSPLERQAPRLLPVAEPSLNQLLGGGLPLGSLCEATGPLGAGLASFAFSVLASASQEAGCAYVDVGGSFSPSCAAAAGVKLDNLLWVRLSDRPTEGTTQSRSSASVPVDNQRERRQLAQQTCGGWHPRSETKNLAPALHQVMGHGRRDKQEGTPGNPNQPLGLHTASKEQVDWERFNLRRVDETDPLRVMDKESADAVRNRSAQALSHAPNVARHKDGNGGWSRLDRALRATDQILQAGGFRVVVLDLALVDAGQALRVPSATWWRFQKAAHKSDSILLLLTPEACARSSAACVLECSPNARPVVQGVLTSIARTVEIGRQRIAVDASPFKKAPGRATDWHTVPQWMRAAGA